MYQVLYLCAVPENLLFATCGSARSIHLQIIVADTEFRNSNKSYFEKCLKKVEKIGKIELILFLCCSRCDQIEEMSAGRDFDETGR